MKLALIGAGSYVFAPTFLIDAITRHRLEGLELALVDPNLDAAEAMAALARRLAADAGIRLTPELEKGARYVFEDIEGGNPIYVTGGEPFDIAIADKRGSRLILYRKDVGKQQMAERADAHHHSSLVLQEQRNRTDAERQSQPKE